MIESFPRILIAGLRGSGGKSFVSVGLCAALRQNQVAVAPFKKGMDYIDAAWLSVAAGRPCRNLDLFMMEPESAVRSFTENSAGSDIAIIEGNRGLFDGMNVSGSYSSAELAKLLTTPVILVCDCTKTTRTMAAIVSGCQHFDPDLNLRGVVLNRVAGRRHENILRQSVESLCGLPVLGAIPRFPQDPFPERHLGLVPPQEHQEVPVAVRISAEVVAKHLDLEAVLTIARAAAPLDHQPPIVTAAGSPRVRIGVFRDEAFQFFYPENLEALEREGAELITCSPLRDSSVPLLDAVYIGGGFPETFAGQLAGNVDFHRTVAEAAGNGLPIYAECAGAVYLGRSLRYGDSTYPMAGVLPVSFGFEKKPQGHGYTMMEVAGPNPFFEIGESFRGHEFHYTRVLEIEEDAVSFAYRVKRGYGMDGERDGICRGNTLATYCHIHALGVRSWAKGLVRAAISYKQTNNPT